MQDHRSGVAVDPRCTFGAAEILRDHVAFGGGGGPALVPQQDRQAEHGQIAGKGPQDAGAYLYLAIRSGSQAVFDQLMADPTAFSPEARIALQTNLQTNAFYSGALDGDFGPGTQAAIRVAYGLAE